MGAFDFSDQSLLLDGLKRPDGQYLLDRVPQAPTQNNPNPNPKSAYRSSMSHRKKTCLAMAKTFSIGSVRRMAGESVEKAANESAKRAELG